LRRTKRECLDLPEKISSLIPCFLTRNQVVQYNRAIDNLLGLLPDRSQYQRRKNYILPLILKLKQICNDASFGDDAGLEFDTVSGKMSVLIDEITKLSESGDKCLVFTQFVRMGRILCDQLSKVLRQDVSFFQGSLPGEDRKKMVEEFQKDGNSSTAMVVSLRAGGAGITLHKANHVFHYDRWWNPAVEDQATDRVHRIGQEKTVFVHTMVCKGTIEDRIDDLITKKRDVANLVLGNGLDSVIRMSDDELRDWLRLDPKIYPA
jgi:SNF2 family DNA or RNA helicase